MKTIHGILILLLVSTFFIATFSTASAAESWAVDPKTGCQLAWVSDTATLVSASWTGPIVKGKAQGKGVLTVAIRDKAGNENNGQADAEMKAGKLDGKVSIKWSDKSSYDGFYKDGLREGKGVLTFPGGAVYEGDFKNDKFTGKGIFKLSNGEAYEGDYKNNEMLGKGVYKWADGQVYEGDFKKGQMDGKGILKFTNGQTYEGDFRDGKLNGYGMLKDSGGKVIYEGQWNDGQRGTGQDISDEVRKHLNWGKMVLESAKTPKDIEDAIEEFNIAIKLAPDCADAYYRLGVVQEMVNKDEDALKNLKKYLELSPAGATVKEARNLIDKLEYKAYKKVKVKKEMEALGVLTPVLIPAGAFMMGDPKGEGDDNEHPQHKVYLDAYYIDKYEVTVAQYREYCSATGKSMPPAPPWGWQDNLPMCNVTWEDANAYAQYYGKRLPTEAEWEKAARAGSTTKYCFGDSESELSGYAWYADNSNKMLNPVATKKPNAFGLYDMHGNAAEWCSDWYGANYYKVSPARNPKGPASGPHHVARGGDCDDLAVYSRSAFRFSFEPNSFARAGMRTLSLGFRCASSVKKD